MLWGPYLLLQAVEEVCIITLFTHELVMGAALSDLSVLHQNNLVTLGQVLREKKDGEKTVVGIKS